MVSLTNPFKKKHNSLNQYEIEAHISVLEKSFDSLWNSEIDKLYRSLMQTMGKDFTYPKTIHDEYKADVARFAKDIKFIGFSDKEKKLSVYETSQGHILANQNRIEFSGQKFSAATADTMAFIAVHDKDMIEKGVSLDGNDIYQKALLQLSIHHHDEGIKIHNKIDPSKLNDADKKLFAHAVSEFNAHQESKNNPATEQKVGIDTGEEKLETPKEPIFSLSDEQYDAVKNDVIAKGKATNPIIDHSLSQNGVNSSDIKTGVKEARERLKNEDFIKVKQRGAVERLLVKLEDTQTSSLKTVFENPQPISASLGKLPFNDYGAQSVKPFAAKDCGKACKEKSLEPLFLDKENKINNTEVDSATETRFLTQEEIKLAQKLAGDFVKTSTSSPALATGIPLSNPNLKTSGPITPAA